MNTPKTQGGKVTKVLTQVGSVGNVKTSSQLNDVKERKGRIRYVLRTATGSGAEKGFRKTGTAEERREGSATRRGTHSAGGLYPSTELRARRPRREEEQGLADSWLRSSPASQTWERAVGHTDLKLRRATHTGEPGHSCWCGQGSGRGTDAAAGHRPEDSMSEQEKVTRGPSE